MFDIQHDSPMPIHAQLTEQIRNHVASGALPTGARLPEYRALAQELVANPHVVARAYDDLEWEGVLKKTAGGAMEVTAAASLQCRVRLQDQARAQLRRAVAQCVGVGVPQADMLTIVQEQLAAHAAPLSETDLKTAIQISSHDRRHRASAGVQDLSRQDCPGSP